MGETRTQENKKIEREREEYKKKERECVTERARA